MKLDNTEKYNAGNTESAQESENNVGSAYVQDMQEEPELVTTPLPQPLVSYRAKLTGGAVITTIAAIVAALILKEPRVLLFMFAPAYLVYLSFLIDSDWRKGVLVEVEAVCTAIRAGVIRDQVVVSFCRHDEEEDRDQHFQFTIPNRKLADEFIPDSLYQIYFRVSEQRRLIAYRQI